MTGIADIFALATQYDTTTGVINNLTSKYVLSPHNSTYLRALTRTFRFLAGVSSYLVRAPAGVYSELVLTV